MYIIRILIYLFCKKYFKDKLDTYGHYNPNSLVNSKQHSSTHLKMDIKKGIRNKLSILCRIYIHLGIIHILICLNSNILVKSKINIFYRQKTVLIKGIHIFLRKSCKFDFTNKEQLFHF